MLLFAFEIGGNTLKIYHGYKLLIKWEESILLKVVERQLKDFCQKVDIRLLHNGIKWIIIIINESIKYIIGSLYD